MRGWLIGLTLLSFCSAAHTSDPSHSVLSEVESVPLPLQMRDLAAIANPTQAPPQAIRSLQWHQDLPHAFGLIIVLSPRMPLALQEWPRMKNLAERAGFKVVTVRDPRVPAAEWKQAVQAAGQDELRHAPAIDESDAAALGLLNHSPATLVVRCGRVHPWPILGVMPDNHWSSVLKARTQQLGAHECN